MGDLICFSHLRWDFVWQRPQHLLSRLAKQHRVLFVEEPISTTDAYEPRLEVIPGRSVSDVTVLRLIQPVQENRWIGHGDPLTQETYTRLLQDYLRAEGYTDPILWIYTPMALDFVDATPHRLLIADVMDQLSAFKGAPTELVEREARLLTQADLVFTGGVSLYRAKLPFNRETYLFPSGVEIEHFAQAADPEAFDIPADLVEIPHPILGYFGVIDERMDLTLLAQAARLRPDWHFVLLGPVVKIDPAELPQAANLHYLGMKSYEQLPAYLAQFDVALIPFALNEATRYLSPTKTLEYMAARKPILSTPIFDVVELYGDVVRIVRSPDEFVRQAEAAMIDTSQERRLKAEELLARQTWDSIARQMGQLINPGASTPPRRAAAGSPAFSGAAYH